MKRILSLLLALVIAISAAVPAYATGDGNMDSGGSGSEICWSKPCIGPFIALTVP